MPLCTLALLCLSTPVPTFLTALQNNNHINPLIIARPIRWIIPPRTLSSSLLSQKWDLLLLLPSTSTSEALPTVLAPLITSSFTLVIGVPSRLISSLATTNPALLHPPEGSIPPLTGALQKPFLAQSTGALELTSELASWARAFTADGRGAVSMLNLLAFKPGMLESYLAYGKAFGEKVGSRRGGLAKIVGKVVAEGGKGEWDEVAIAHYPSAEHFADMLASADYQEVNQRLRVPSLMDTCILCTSELELPWSTVGGGSKL